MDKESPTGSRGNQATSVNQSGWVKDDANKYQNYEKLLRPSLEGYKTLERQYLLRIMVSPSLYYYFKGFVAPRFVT
jgi:hypothetical protein